MDEENWAAGLILLHMGPHHLQEMGFGAAAPIKA